MRDTDRVKRSSREGGERKSRALEVKERITEQGSLSYRLRDESSW